MNRWEASEDWHSRHTTDALVYTVYFEFASTEAADAVWDALTATHTVGEENNVYNGGASIARVSSTVMYACSGGQDGLDSLEDTMNDCLDEAISSAGDQRPELREGRALEPKIFREIRELCRD